MFYVNVVEYSENPLGGQVASIEWRFPRKVLAETVTHRMLKHDLGVEELLLHDTTTTDDLSKNSASSRAIPFKDMLAAVEDDPYYPERWSKNCAGMSEKEYFSDQERSKIDEWWEEALEANLKIARKMAEAGVHKQDVNRLLEPWAWTVQVVTATEWDNFWALRCDHAADPAFRTAARLSYLALKASTPRKLKWDEWHLPYVKKAERETLSTEECLKLSTARVAWTSYASPDKSGDPAKAYATYAKLVGSAPLHASPAEAQAQAKPPRYFADHPEHQSNLKGWLQHRKLLAGENVTCYLPEEAEVDRWRLEAAAKGYPVRPYSPEG